MLSSLPTEIGQLTAENGSMAPYAHPEQGANGTPGIRIVPVGGYADTLETP